MTEPLPELVEFVDEVCGLYFRSILIRNAGTRVPQHVHPYDHATYCGSGSAMMYVEGVPIRTVSAGEAVEVKANKQHAFEALEPNTRLTCVHDARSALAAKEK